MVKSLVHRVVHLQAAAVSPQQTHNNACPIVEAFRVRDQRKDMLKFLYLIRCDYLKCSSFFALVCEIISCRGVPGCPVPSEHAQFVVISRVISVERCVT